MPSRPVRGQYYDAEYMPIKNAAPMAKTKCGIVTADKLALTRSDQCGDARSDLH